MLDKLRSLQSQFPVKISVGGELEVPDEFVETEYYRELDSIDKLHQTTGNGFTRMKAKRMENRFIRPPLGSNPATNDCIPKEFYILDCDPLIVMQSAASNLKTSFER